MLRGQQVGLGNGGIGAGESQQDMRRDDRQLVIDLTLVQLMGQQDELIGIQTAILAKSEIVCRHGVVASNDLDRQVRLRLEIVTGNGVGDFGR
jgi:hypothetical protein